MRAENLVARQPRKFPKATKLSPAPSSPPSALNMLTVGTPFKLTGFEGKLDVPGITHNFRGIAKNPFGSARANYIPSSTREQITVTPGPTGSLAH